MAPGGPAPDSCTRTALILKPLILLLLLGGLFLVVRYFQLEQYVDNERLRTLIAGCGVWAPLAYLAVWMISPFLLLPVTPLIILGGILFGPFWGELYILTGATASAVLALVVARYLARDFVAAKIAHTRLADLGDRVTRHGWKIVLVSRLQPIFPFALLNFAFGLTRIPLPRFALATFFGLIPITSAYVFFSEIFLDLLRGNSSWIMYLAFALLLVLLAGTVLFCQLKKNAGPAEANLPRNFFAAPHFPYQLALIFALAVAISILYNIFYVGVQAAPEADAKDYILIGRLLAQDGTWLTFGRPPLLPLLLAVWFTVGFDVLQARIFLSFVGAGTCVLIALMAREIFHHQKTAFAAGIAAAVYPMLFYWHGFVLTETLNTFWITAATLMVITFLNRGQAGYLVLAGLGFGLAALTRPEGLFISGFVVLWLILEQDLRAHFFRYFITYTTALLLVVGPWILFVSLKCGTFVPIKTGGGYTFSGANNRMILKSPFGAWGGHIDPFDAGLLKKEDFEGLSEVERDRLFMRHTLTFISQNPGEMAVLLFWKVVNLFRFHPSAYSSWPFKLLAFCSYLVVFILAVVGIWKNALKSQATRFLLVIILAYIANALIFLGDTRFRNALEPALLIFAIYGFQDLAARFGRPPGESGPPSLMSREA